MLTESEVQRSFNLLFKSTPISEDIFERAEALLDELRPESPLRHRLTIELEALRSLVSSESHIGRRKSHADGDEGIPSRPRSQPFESRSGRSSPNLTNRNRDTKTTRHSNSHPLSLYFPLDEFNSQEVAAIVGYLSLLYAEEGGDSLQIDDISVVEIEGGLQ